MSKPEEFIEEKKQCVDAGCFKDKHCGCQKFVSEDDLRELGKTHVVLLRNIDISDDLITRIQRYMNERGSLRSKSEIRLFVEAMIAAAEEIK